MKKKYKYYITTLLIIFIIILSVIVFNPPIEGRWNIVYKNPNIANFNSLIVFVNGKIICYSSYSNKPVTKSIGGKYEKTGYCQYKGMDNNNHITKFNVGWFYMNVQDYIGGNWVSHEYKRNFNFWATNKIIKKTEIKDNLGVSANSDSAAAKPK